MDPITIGIAALAALVLSACGGSGGSKSQSNTDDADAGMAGAGGNNATEGTGGRPATGGTNGMAGNGGASGSSGAGGVSDSGGMGGAEDDAGVDGSSYVDAATPNSTNPTSYPYRFSFRYGTPDLKPFYGTGTLMFSEPDSCQLLGGSFDVEEVGGTQNFGLSLDLPINQSLDFCTSQITLPLAGGIFDGMSWMLEPFTVKESYQVTACTLQTDGGVALENCQGSLDRQPQ